VLDTNQNWVADLSQPVGVNFDGLAVDADGNPALIDVNSPHHLWHKQGESWLEHKECSEGVQFIGNTIYRQNCAKQIYEYEFARWNKLSE